MTNKDTETQLNLLFDICHQNLKTSDKCLDYLYGSRRLSIDSVNKFNIGYFPQNINTLLKYVSPEILKQLKIIDFYGQSQFSDFFYLVFPIVSEYNQPVGIGGRCLLDPDEREGIGLPKYKNSSFNKNQFLYGLNLSKRHILRTQNVYIVEGYFDQIALNSNGILNSVAICGTSFTKNHFLKLARYTNKMTFLLDQDEGGLGAMNKIYQKYFNFGVTLEFKTLPNGFKDIDEYFMKNSSKTFLTDLNNYDPNQKYNIEWM